ncbi:MAG: HAMP domain-containing histidine kinase, partial [Armatimonadetes bacterium]|nr:HAMP domain-containing histidine kinase [Armatimonadota bacterium]
AHAKHVTLGADKTDGYIRITVTDDGVGMDEATRQRALEPFFTTKPCGKGTGLGLSICHSVAEAHGGTLGIESQRHAGTRVSLSLPAIGED